MITKNKSLILFQLLSIALLFSLFIFKINTIFLLLGLLITYLYIRKNRVKYYETKDTFIFTIVALVIAITIYYLIGLLSNYESNYASIFYKYISKTEVLINVSIIILSELIRPIIIKKIYRKNIKYNINIILFIIVYVLIDMNISVRTKAFSSIKQFYLLLGMVILPSISKNILLNFLTKNKKNKSSMTYRLMNDLYIYLLPIMPVMNLYYEAILLVIFPYIYYLFYSMFFVKQGIKEKQRRKTLYFKLSILVYVFVFLVITAIVSGLFKYKVLAIGSESMSGIIDKGDAIILHKVNPKKLKTGDIIIFEKNSTVYVHRIIEKYGDDNGIMFITKGDANRTKDMWVVYEKDIKGIYDFRIKYIGYPSVWLSGLF